LARSSAVGLMRVEKLSRDAEAGVAKHAAHMATLEKSACLANVMVFHASRAQRARRICVF